MSQGQSSGRLVIVVKGFVKLPNLHTLLKQEFITFQKLGSRGFWQIANSVLNRGKSAERCCPEVLSPASDKASCLLKTFLRTLIFMTSVSLYMFFLLELI